MTEEDKTPWWKRPWTWVVAIVTVVGGLLAILFTLGRKGNIRVTKPKGLEIPDRPDTPDVVVPDRKDVDTKPKADYDEKKVEPASNIDEAIARANDRD